MARSSASLRSSISHGFTRKLQAPTRIASTANGRSAHAVRIMKGVRRWRLGAIVRRNSRPTSSCFRSRFALRSRCSPDGGIPMSQTIAS
jgi:hypothetical protein